MATNRDNWRGITLFLLLMFAILIININAPFYGHHEPNGVWIGTSIRNWNWYGFVELGGIPATTAEPVASVNDLYRYVHHPPLVVWVTYGASKLLGETITAMPREITLRIVSVFSTMLTISLIYVIARRMIGLRWALLIVAIYGLTPMIGYFGRMPNHEHLAMVFIYGFIAVFINWLRRYSHMRTIYLMVLAIFAMWTAWAGAFFFFVLALVVLVFGTAKHRFGIVGIGVVTGIATLAIPLFFEWQHAGAIQELIDAFLYRASSSTLAPDSVEFTAWRFIQQWFIHMLTSMGYGVVLLAFVGLISVVRLRQKQTRYIILALWLAPFLYMMTFRNASFVHDYYKIYYLLGFALTIGLLIKNVWSQSRRKSSRNRVLRPVIVGIWITSFILGIFWFYLLHNTGDDAFQSAIANDVQSLTTTDDTIYSEFERKAGLEYYTYRQWVWDVNEASFTHSRDNSYFLACPLDGAETYEGVLQSQPYEVIANGECRLISLSGS